MESEPLWERIRCFITWFIAFSSFTRVLIEESGVRIYDKVYNTVTKILILMSYNSYQMTYNHSYP